MFSNGGAGEDSWESLNNKEIKSTNLKGNQPTSFEWLMLKFQYFGHLMQRADSLNNVNKFLGDIDAAGPGTILWEPLVYIKKIMNKC